MNHDRLIVRFLGRGARDHQPAGLAHPPEMKCHQHDDHGGKDGGVQGEKGAQGGRPDLTAAQDDLLQPAADDGDVFQHADADGGGPIGKLVPGEQVPGKIGCQHEDEKTEPDDPVQPARGVKAAGKKDPQAMQANHHDQEVGAPEMHVADQLTEQETLLKVHQRLVGLGGNRPVGKLQQDAGEQLQRHKQGCNAAQNPGQGETQRLFSNPARSEMQDQRG